MPETSAISCQTVIDALIAAHMKLNPARLPSTVFLTSPCADLWDDQLELIELLMEIDANLALGRELDWQKAPPRTASVNDLIDWIMKEMANG